MPFLVGVAVGVTGNAEGRSGVVALLLEVVAILPPSCAREGEKHSQYLEVHSRCVSLLL